MCPSARCRSTSARSSTSAARTRACSRSAALRLAVCAALLAMPAFALGRRKPVLPQIDLPHSYYYRELYLPQMTSGPAAAAWSPDGELLVNAMQGFLWRQRVDGPVRSEERRVGKECRSRWSPYH